MIDQKISHITDKGMLVAEAASSGKENSWQNEQLCLRLLGRRAFTHLRRFLGYAQNVPTSHEYGLASSFISCIRWIQLFRHYFRGVVRKWKGDIRKQFQFHF